MYSTYNYEVTKAKSKNIKLKQCDYYAIPCSSSIVIKLTTLEVAILQYYKVTEEVASKECAVAFELKEFQLNLGIQAK